jgi:hypothetical protein
MARTNWKGLITGAIALAGLSAAAVYIIKKLRENAQGADEAIDELLDVYKTKAAELDRLIEPDLRIAN